MGRKKLGAAVLDDSDGDEVALVRRQAHEYASETSIHGIKYVGEQSRTMFERLLWLFLVIGSVALCAYSIAPIYDKWVNTPTITSIATTNYAIWNIHFPAVTICSNNKVVGRQFRAAIRKKPWNGTAYKSKNLTTEEWEKGAQICHTMKKGKSFDNTTAKCGLHSSLLRTVKKYVFFSTDKDIMANYTRQEEYIMDNNARAIPTLMQQVMQKCKDMILLCFWQGEVTNCMELFSVRRTDNGFCCSFNAVRMDEQFASLDDSELDNPDDSDDYDAYGGYGGDYEGGGYGDYGGGGYGDYGGYGGYGDYNYYDETSTTTEDNTGNNGQTTSTTDTTTTATDTTTTSDTTTTTDTTSTTTTDTTTTTTETTTTPDPGVRRRRKRAAAATTTTAKPTTTKSMKDELKRSNSANVQLGLTVVLNADTPNYMVGMNNFYGFRVLVHSPYEYPEVSGKGFAIGSKKEAFIGVSARVTESTDTVKSMGVKRRNCIKVDEDLSQTDVVLEAFKDYSKSSCLLECRARKMRDMCGCLPYFFPDFAKVWNKSTTCGFEGLECLANITSSLYKLKPDVADSTHIVKDNLLEGTDCDCPIACDEVLYSQELSVAELRDNSNIFEKLMEAHNGTIKLVKDIKDMNQSITHYTENYMKQDENEEWKFLSDDKLKSNFGDNFTLNSTQKMKYRIETFRIENYKQKLADLKANTSVVHIYFKELGVVKYTRDEYLGPMEVIASFGGIVGLCMGFSLLSLAELIYFFTLRMWVDIRRKSNAAMKASKANSGKRV